MTPKNPPPAQTWQLRLLRVWVWFTELVRPSELQVTLIWAGIIGFLGALASVGFRHLIHWVHWLLTNHWVGSLVESFTQLPAWQRLLIPAVGGALAGMTLYFGSRIKPGKSTTDYMEAIVLGDGVISSRLSLVKCASALFSIASGASIGREGPLVQLAAHAGIARRSAALAGIADLCAAHAKSLTGGRSRRGTAAASSPKPRAKRWAE